MIFFIPRGATRRALPATSHHTHRRRSTTPQEQVLKIHIQTCPSTGAWPGVSIVTMPGPFLKCPPTQTHEARHTHTCPPCPTARAPTAFSSRSEKSCSRGYPRFSRATARPRSHCDAATVGGERASRPAAAAAAASRCAPGARTRALRGWWVRTASRARRSCGTFARSATRSGGRSGSSSSPSRTSASTSRNKPGGTRGRTTASAARGCRPPVPQGQWSAADGGAARDDAGAPVRNILAHRLFSTSLPPARLPAPRAFRVCLFWQTCAYAKGIPHRTANCIYIIWFKDIATLVQNTFELI